MKLSEIIDAWQEDSKVDDLNVDQEAARVSNLHSKYVSMLSQERSKLRGMDMQRRASIRELRDYYLGVATKEELAQLGRDPYPQRILKNEVMFYVESDQMIIEHDARMSVQQEKVDVLLEIMKSINSRNFQFKTMIDWRRLMLGA